MLRRAEQTEWHATLRLVLGHGGMLADDTRVMDFIRYALSRKIDLTKLTVADAGGRILWGALPITPPGRTTLVLSPGWTPPGLAVPATSLIEVILEIEASVPHGALLAQALVDPLDPSASEPFYAAGFERLATLLYLQKSITHPVMPPTVPERFRAYTYSGATHAMFRQAIEASYAQSLDCPKLNGHREVDDVIEGHKGVAGASGDFRADLWTMLTEGEGENERPAAVLLLGPAGNGETLELVYLGVCPEYRRQGLARWALRKALWEAYRNGLPKLTLAVDAENRPALKLYYGFGLKRVHERLALMKPLARPESVEPGPITASEPTPAMRAGVTEAPATPESGAG